MSKTFKTALSAFLLSSCLIAPGVQARVDDVVSPKPEYNHANYLGVEGWAGDYLASRFGQSQHDWGSASLFMRNVLDHTPNNPKVHKHAMVLAMGAGETDLAFSMAQESLDLDKEEPLALIFLAAQAIKEQKFEKALDHINAIPDAGISGFIVPLLKSWSEAAVGNHSTENLNGNTIHIHHAILIADYLGQHEQIEKLLKRALENGQLSAHDTERIADLYAHIDDMEKATQLYKGVLALEPDNIDVAEKIAKIKNGEDMHIFESIVDPATGVALAFYDTAQTLHSEYNDDSARLFAHLAHYMNPDDTATKFLLSDIAARHDRSEEAIGFLQTIPSTDENYKLTQRHIADLLIKAERYEDALHTLQYLVDRYDDIDAMIQIGDIHRREDNFKSALKAYNTAAKRLGKDIPANYWHVYYMRGICYERLGEWDKAEADLQTALSYEPEHPFVLNYLGYAWADQGQNLNQALNMIEKAADLRPADGYITDSLGWVLYRMGQYEEAVPHLEKAVELLPYDPVINDHLGDSYWQVGRKLEARFQWERAKNHAEEEDLVLAITEKLKTGLTNVPVVREANSKQIQTDAQ